jgi:ABC-2 type transport system permease protein
MILATWRRVAAMTIKELWALLRDPRARVTLIAPPILQLALFGFAATLEVKNIDLGIYNRDRGGYGQALIERLAGSPNVKRIVPLESPQAVRDALDNGQVIGVLSLDERFSRDIAAGRPASVQAVYDGRRSNAAQIVNGYINQIVGGFGAELKSAPTAETDDGAGTSVVNWFNPNLDYMWFTMPSLIVTLAALSVLSVTGQSIARERELGTFDQLMVSPLRTWEILAGKTIPALLLGAFNATVFLVLIPLLFHVPFRGSVMLFYVALFCYLFALVGVGLFISIISRTQQQAFLGMFLAMVPLILLSGFTSPVDNMPTWLQVVAEVDPLKHFVVIVEGLFLKGMGRADVIANLWPLLVIAGVTLTGSALFFRARKE